MCSYSWQNFDLDSPSDHLKFKTPTFYLKDSYNPRIMISALMNAIRELSKDQPSESDINPAPIRGPDDRVQRGNNRKKN